MADFTDPPLRKAGKQSSRGPVEQQTVRGFPDPQQRAPGDLGPGDDAVDREPEPEDLVRLRGTASNAASASGKTTVELTAWPIGRNGATTISVVSTGVPGQLPVDAFIVPVEPSGELRIFGQRLREVFRKELESRIRMNDGRRPTTIALTSRPSPAYSLKVGGRSLGPLRPSASLVAVPFAGPQAGVRVAEETRAGIAAALEELTNSGTRTVVLPLVEMGPAGVHQGELVDGLIVALRTVAVPTGLEDIIISVPNERERELVVAAASGDISATPSNDLPSGRDRLDVETEARSIVEMISLSDAEPPLAVGIIGDWGGGKSFFMHLMMRAVLDQRRTVVSKAEAWGGTGAAGVYAGHTYVVRFNAWTYAKTSLWAALMKEIIEQLDNQMKIESALRDRAAAKDNSPATLAAELATFPDYVGEDADAVAARLELRSFLDRVGGSGPSSVSGIRAFADRQVEAARRHRGAIAEQVAEIDAEYRARAERDATNVLKGELARRVRAIASHSLRRATPLADGTASVNAIRNDLRGIAVDTGAVARLNGRSFLWAAAVAALGLASTQIDAIVDAVTAWPGVAAVVGALAGTAKTASAVRAQVFDARQQLEAAIAAADIEIKEQIEAEADRLRSEDAGSPRAVRRAELVREEQEATETLEAAKRLLNVAKDHRQLSDIVSQKASTGDYDGELGLMHRIKADLDELRRPLKVSDEIDPNSPYALAFPRGLPRVMVFIDDLDRCPPERVVEIFEAAQLLLRSELFVLVIAIDDRYVTRALEKRYEGVLDARRAPTGHDYLEKIIQIPYRLRPVDPDAIDEYLGSLLRPDSSETGEAATPVDGPAGDLDQQTRTDGGLEPAGVGGPPVSVLGFDEAEQSIVTEALAGRQLAPRSIKRIVNVIKLVKLIQHRRQDELSGRDLRRVVDLLATAAADRHQLHDAFYLVGDPTKQDALKTLVGEAAELPGPLLRTVLSFAFTCQAPGVERGEGSGTVPTAPRQGPGNS